MVIFWTKIFTFTTSASHFVRIFTKSTFFYYKNIILDAYLTPGDGDKWNYNSRIRIN